MDFSGESEWLFQSSISIIAVTKNNTTKIEPMTILVGRLVFQKNTTIMAPKNVRML
jgi:hypothetical protein